MLEENMEIIFCDINKLLINCLITELNIKESEVNSSHFYSFKQEKDLELDEIEDFRDIFDQPNTGNIHLKELFLGTTIRDVIIILSFDNISGDIVVNFNREQLSHDSYGTGLFDILQYCRMFQDKYEIQSIRVGFESAYDNEMTLIVLNRNDNVPEKFDELLARLSI